MAEILDPEGHVLGRTERSVDIAQGDGSWQQALKPTSRFPSKTWSGSGCAIASSIQRRQAAAIEGIASISQILRRPVVHVLGQTEYLAGSRAAIRVIVADANNNDIAEPGMMRIELWLRGQNARLLFSGPIDERGTLEAQFRFPAGLTGRHQLRFVADTAVGSTEFTQPIKLRRKRPFS